MPTASINPVNIAFDQDVVAARFDTAVVEGGGRERPPGEQRHPARSEGGGRHVQPHTIDHTRIPGGRAQGGPPSSSSDVTPSSPSRRRAAAIDGVLERLDLARQPPQSLDCRGRFA